MKLNQKSNISDDRISQPWINCTQRENKHLLEDTVMIFSVTIMKSQSKAQNFIYSVTVIKRISLYSSDTYKAPPVLWSWRQWRWSWRWCWGASSGASDQQSSDPLRTECRCCKAWLYFIKFCFILKDWFKNENSVIYSSSNLLLFCDASCCVSIII